MNERIRELMVQADYPAPEIAKRAHVLAELIVRECISMADNESERYSNLDQEYCSMAMDNYRELVRKHFGVEE
jgi:hypothetical protein